jgi:WXG100 family type VII secretion target
MTVLRLDVEAVKSIIARIDTQHIEIDTVLTNLRAINIDLEGAWDGSAQIEFEKTYGNWIQQLDNYSETLTSVKGYLQSVSDNYVALDEAARAAAAGATQG